MNRHPERAQDYLEHILEALERIQRYTAGKSVEEFEADTLWQRASDSIYKEPRSPRQRT